jgi:hypothetical protein
MEDFKAWLRSITVPMWISCAMVVGAALYVLVRAARSDDPLLLLLALTGALIGWVVGILATPLSDAEGQRFGELAKVISGFVSGYLLSKLDPLVSAFLKPPAPGQPLALNAQTAQEVLLSLISFFIALLFVFGGRMYWSPDKDEAPLREWIEKRPGKKLSRKDAIKLLVEKAR